MFIGCLDPFCAFFCSWSYFLILNIHLLEDKQGLGLGEFVSCILFIFYPHYLALLYWDFCITILALFGILHLVGYFGVFVHFR